MAPLEMRPMGSQGLKASMQGYGAMGLTSFYGPSLPLEKAHEVLEKAYELGVRHFDSAEMYLGKDEQGNDTANEAYLGPFIKAKRASGDADITFATKYWPAFDNPEKGACGREAVRQAVESSLEKLGLDCIDLYYLHRIPPGEAGKENAALRSWMEACKELVAEGKIKYLGLSEATPAEIRFAHAIHPLTAIQQEWSLLVRSLEVELVPTCRELGIAIVAYSPLCRGFTSNLVKTDADWDKVGTAAEGNKFQKNCPHLTGDNLAANAALLAPLEEAAKELGVTPAQLSLAWVHAQGPDVFPIPGTTKTANLEANVKAAQLKVDEAIVKRIAVDPEAVKGERYPDFILGACFDKKA